MKPISPEKVAIIKKMLEKGLSTRKIANEAKVSQFTVMNIKKKENIAVPAPKTGRPKLVSDRCARLIGRNLVQGISKTPKAAARELSIEASVWTIRRSLKRNNFKAAKKPKKPKLSMKNIAARLRFAKIYKNWTVDDWKRVIWSDETKINRFNSDGVQYFWSHTGKATTSNQIIETVKHGGGSIMIWGCFSYFGVGPLEQIKGTMRKEQYLSLIQDQLPVAIGQSEFEERNIVFQQDNDPKHASKLVSHWLKTQQFQVLEWPAQSPDLNPIENLWSIIKRKLGAYENPPTGMNELWERVNEEWANISIEVCENLVKSMPKRLKQVITNKGFHTSY